MKKSLNSVLPKTQRVAMMEIHRDRLKNFIILQIWCLCFVLMFSQHSLGEEVKDYPSQFALIKSVREKFTHNRTSIKTWSGDVDVIKKDYEEDGKTLTYETKYEVAFLCDYVHQRQRFFIVPSICCSYTNGTKIPSTLRQEFVLWKDNTTYVRETFTPTTPTAFDHRGKILVSDFLQPTNTSFQPRLDSLPFPPTDIDSIYFSFDVSEKGVEEKLKDGLSDDAINKMHEKMLESGHPRYTIEKNGGVVNIYDKWNEGHVFKIDLDKGAQPTLFKSKGKTWTCELQEVNGVWIPRKTNDLFYASDGTAHHIEMLWRNQRIDTPLSQDEFTLVKIGARQGDEGYDYRTDSTFIIDGNEYPPPEGVEYPTSNWFSTVRLVLIGLGLLLFLMGSIGLLRGRKGEKT